MPKEKTSPPVQEKFEFNNEALYQKVCGINDSRLKDLESYLGITIIPRGYSLIVNGQKDKVDIAMEFFKNLVDNYKKRPDKEDFDSFDLNYLIKQENTQDGWTPSEKILSTFKGKQIFPRTKNQEKFVHSLMKNLITFGVGPAGTGKTFLSIAVACRMLQSGEIDRLVLTRPAVEAGESLGFLPGDLTQKVDPYLRPIYDALHECIGFERVQVLISLNKIEIAPIAFMRGRTLNNSFIILDEAQNCTVSQLKMFLTRIGKNSRMSLSGDVTQIDLERGRSGLEKVLSIMKDTPQIGIMFLEKEDITRHPLVSVIVDKFEGI
ncbi:MAG: PhoH family protein [Leptospiraceae bacterium]|nr:PhoH family protein [Leptospiraceae bacterium]MBK7056394.1 PhoH family protein [Leptospiraceae bacterium]MBK9503747.1 PhoH family protein [Leptospiraceae bacterium]